MAISAIKTKLINSIKLEVESGELEAARKLYDDKFKGKKDEDEIASILLEQTGVDFKKVEEVAKKPAKKEKITASTKKENKIDVGVAEEGSVPKSRNTTPSNTFNGIPVPVAQTTTTIQQPISATIDEWSTFVALCNSLEVPTRQRTEFLSNILDYYVSQLTPDQYEIFKSEKQMLIDSKLSKNRNKRR